MAICEKCGKNLGVFGMVIEHLCPECYREKEQELKDQKLEEEKRQLCKEMHEKIRKKLDSKSKVFLYKKIYVPVDSTLNKAKLADRFDVSIVQEAGINGWEIVTTVSKTKGISGLAADGAWGMGGNIEGVYFIMRKEITAADIPLSDDEIIDCFMA